MKIRKAKQGDVQECLKLAKKRWGKKDLKKALGDTAVFIVAEENQGIVGFVIGFVNPCKPSQAVIQDVTKAKKTMGKGVGQALVKAFFHTVFEQGAKKVVVKTKRKNVWFYESCGFGETGRLVQLSKKKQ
jgi:N-acetylglutamate synthase-like GNAT family acetyltransferase